MRVQSHDMAQLGFSRLNQDSLNDCITKMDGIRHPPYMPKTRTQELVKAIILEGITRKNGIL